MTKCRRIARKKGRILGGLPDNYKLPFDELCMI